jgi:hypothetical protein
MARAMDSQTARKREVGPAGVRRVAYRQTVSRYPEIVELDNRDWESFYVEAFKPGRRAAALPDGAGRGKRSNRRAAK